MTESRKPSLPRKSFLSASALARRLNLSTPSITDRIASGALLPDAQAGRTFLFSADRFSEISESFHKKPELFA